VFLVAGLGNPGEEYRFTPHNLGFMTIDRLAAQSGIRVTRPDSKALVGAGTIEGQPVMLAKPITYMNLSGTSLRPLMEKHELTPRDLILIFDELDLPWPTLQIRPKGSGGTHNGAKSVVESLGTREFARIRMGINPGRPLADAAEYVLSPFKRKQEKELDELVGLAADAVRAVIAEGVEKAMTKFNRRAGS
jgi:PTH1 family peptidyl-tRNA hydrolase